MWIRFVLVPGLTDGYDNVEKVADFCAGLKSVERVEILRFHQMGSDKWHKLGLDYPLENAEPPDAELDRARARAVPQPRADRLLDDRPTNERTQTMEFVRTLLEQQPLMALFLTIAIGYLVGEINIKGFSLGVGAVLFVALAMGWFAPKSAPAPMVGTLGLALFLYAVGVQYGKQFFLGLTSAERAQGQPASR